MFDPEQFNNLFGGMQKEFADLEQKAKNTQITAKSGGGLVSATINGSGDLIDLCIDNSLLTDKESLQILLISAINDAYKSMEENKKSMAMQAFGGLNLFGTK